jgi:phage terminase small subunit
VEKWELAYKDRQQGMKYKEIAEKYGVSINTVKAWKSRKWNRQDQASNPPPKKVAHKKEKGCTQKKLQPVIDNDELTEQQKMFCLFYLQHFNATKAYQQAYQCDYNSARAAAPRLLAKVSIKEELHTLKAELQQDIFVDVKDLITEYIKQFSADITDFVEVDLTEYEVRDKAGNKVKTKDGEQVIGRINEVYVRSSKDFDGSLVKKITQGKDGISVEMYDKQKAMSELMKYLGGDALREAQLSKLTENDGTTNDQENWKKAVIEAANKRAVTDNG